MDEKYGENENYHSLTTILPYFKPYLFRTLLALLLAIPIGSLAINALKDYMEKKGIELEESYLKNGLSKEEVELRKKTYGPNALPEPKKTPAIILFLEEISNYFSILLWIAAALSFVGYGLSPADYSNLWLAVVIIAIILLSGLFSFIQNQKSGINKKFFVDNHFILEYIKSVKSYLDRKRETKI